MLGVGARIERFPGKVGFPHFSAY